MKVVAFINEKGGTGKTTFAVNTAAFFALHKSKRVLLVDMDSQGHGGKTLGVNVRMVPKSVYDVMMNPELTLAEAVLPTRVEGLSLLPANKSLASFPEDAAGLLDRHLLFRGVIAQADKAGYDLVMVDCPPTMGLITTNILLAATDVVIPVSLTYLALDGCAEIVESIRRLHDEHPYVACKLSLVVPTMYRKTKLADQIIVLLKRHFPTELSKVILSMNVKLDEAQSHGKTIWEYDPNGKGAQMMKTFALELARKILSKRAS